jgi:hypothetical protein
MTLTSTHLVARTALADDRVAEVNTGLLAKLRVWGLVMPALTEPMTIANWASIPSLGGSLPVSEQERNGTRRTLSHD